MFKFALSTFLILLIFSCGRTEKEQTLNSINIALNISLQYIENENISEPLMNSLFENIENDSMNYEQTTLFSIIYINTLFIEVFNNHYTEQNNMPIKFEKFKELDLFVESLGFKTRYRDLNDYERNYLSSEEKQYSLIKNKILNKLDKITLEIDNIIRKKKFSNIESSIKEDFEIDIELRNETINLIGQ